jgi:glycosyltransferase involved in cell wall biosynthesis
VRAMAEVRASVPDAVLVVPGRLTPHADELRAVAGRLGVGDALVLPGWTSNGDLEGLYALAACFAFPSTREGFGLPVLEAMRRRVPVACAAASSLPEVAGDAALYFDPHSSAEIAGAVRRILEDRELAQRLRDAGWERQAQFTWRRTAEGTLACYDRAMSAAARRTGRP